MEGAGSAVIVCTGLTSSSMQTPWIGHLRVPSIGTLVRTADNSALAGLPARCNARALSHSVRVIVQASRHCIVAALSPFAGGGVTVTPLADWNCHPRRTARR